MAGGTLRTDLALWTERFQENPFAKLRQSIDLYLRYKKGLFRLVLNGHASYDFAYLYERASYDAPTLRAYERQVLPREALVGLSLGRFELTLGYQIVAWGQGNVFSPLDVVNPRDMREPGMAELEDLRLPVLATRLGYFRNNHSVEAMMIHLPAFGLRPPPLGPFSPLPELFSPGASGMGRGVPDAMILFAGKDFQHIAPEFNQQLLLRYTYSGRYLDLATYAATVFDQQGVINIQDPMAFLAAPDIAMEHRRYYVLGTSFAVPAKIFLLKGEVSTELQRPLNVGSTTAFPPRVGVATTYLANTMFGVSFTGLRNLELSIEVTKGWLFSIPSELIFRPDRLNIALVARYLLFKERLQLQAVAVLFGEQLQQGFFVRGEAMATVRDGLKIKVGYITYQPGLEFGPLTGLRRHDRLYLGLRWDFSLL